MIRHAILIGAFLGVSASFPIIYKAGPVVLEAVKPSEESYTVLSATPDEGRVARQSAAVGGRRVVLASSSGGHYFGDFRLNGRRVTAMIDTGASALAINLTTARRIGLSVSSADLTSFVSTANGKARATSTVIERVEIGRISLTNVPALVLEDEALDGTLIGMSVLGRLKSYTVEAGSMVLVQ